MLEVIKKKIRHHSLTGRITPAVMHKAFKAVCYDPHCFRRIDSTYLR